MKQTNSKPTVRRRYRRKIVEQPTPYHQGQAVVVEQSHTFRGKKLAIVIGKCRHNDGGITCQLVNPGEYVGFSEVCIQTQRGDKIDPLSKIQNTE